MVIPDHFSVSQIRTYLKCPTQYAFKYVLNVKPQRQFGRVVLGSAVHAMLRAANLMVLHGPPDKDVLIETARSSLAACKDAPIDWGSLQNEDTCMERVKAIADRIQDIIKITAVPAFIEKEFELDIEYARLKGIVDVVTCDGRLYDYKVTSRRRTQDEVRRDIQLATYALCFNPSTVGLICITDAGKVHVVESAPIEPDRTLAILKAVVQSIKWAIASDSFAPNTEGWHCSPSHCQYYELCPYTVGSWEEIEKNVASDVSIYTDDSEMDTE